MPRPTNSDLDEKLKHLNSNFSEFKKEVKEWMQTMEKDMKPIRDFVLIRKDRESRKADGSVNWLALAKQLAVAITVALSIVAAALKFIIEEINR